jgi:hypothetical protein
MDERLEEDGEDGKKKTEGHPDLSAFSAFSVFSA